MASEYGWSKKEVLEAVYIDEYLVMLEHIERRKFSDYRIDLAIVQNPHLKPEDQKELWKKLNNYSPTPPAEDKLDKSAFERMKSIMSRGTGFTVK